MTKQLEDLFDQVTQRVDEEYVDSETQFIQNGDDASSFLRLQKRTCADPFGRFMARTIAGWIDRKSDEYKQALDFLDRTERRVKGSPVGTPRPNVTSEDLTVIYERRLTTFFALRLVKQPG